MKNKHLQFKYKRNASRLHRTVGDCLRNSDLFKHYEILQELPVVKINKNYSESNHRYDWVILTPKIVIECHGAQHFEPVAFDGDNDKACIQFVEIQKRDQAKKLAALEAGYTYVEIPYYLEKKISDQLIIELINIGSVELEEYNRNCPTTPSPLPEDPMKEIWKQRQKEIRKEYLESDRHKEELKKARRYRRDRYQRLKQTRRPIE